MDNSFFRDTKMSIISNVNQINIIFSAWKTRLFQLVLNSNQKKELAEYYKTCGLHSQRTFTQMINGTRLLHNYFILPFSVFTSLVVNELCHHSVATSQNIENETRIKLYSNDELITSQANHQSKATNSAIQFHINLEISIDADITTAIPHPNLSSKCKESFNNY